MTKIEFLAKLREGLAGLPQEDLEERLLFYGEMIDDRIEDGLTEEEAVSNIGDVETVAAQIIAEIPLSKIVKERIKPKRKIGAWAIVLIVLGSPIWLSLLIAVLAVAVAVYAVIWSLAVVLWSVDLACAAGAFAGLVSAAATAVQGGLPQCLLLIALSFVSAGLAVLLWFVCIKITKGTLLIAKKFFVGIKRCFIKKEK